MKQFDCELYMDLMPLVKDGAASAATEQALMDHLTHCDDCRALYRTLRDAPAAPAAEDAAKTLAKLRRNLALGMLLVAIVGALVGIGLNGGEHLFYNVLILPAVGCATYAALRRYSLFAPVGMYLLCFVWFVVQAVATGELVLNADGSISLSNLLGGTALWSALYTGVFCVGLLLAWLTHLAFSRTSRLPKLLRVALAGAAAAVLGGVILFANSLVGNPVCKAIAKNHAEKMLARDFAALDVEIEAVNFNFKTGGYYVRVRSDSSIDTHFTICYNAWGQYTDDTYEAVIDGSNTLDRLNEAYHQQVRQVLRDHYGEEVLNIGYGSIVAYIEATDYTYYPQVPALNADTLQLDGQYDMPALGSAYGEICVYLSDPNVTYERAAELLLQLRGLLEANGVYFYAIDFVLMSPRNPDGSWNENGVEIRVENFPCAEIYAEGLAQRIADAHDALMAYYAAEDAKYKD